MARKPKVQQTNVIPFDRRTGADLGKVKAELRDIYNSINGHKNHRTSSNEEIAALRARAVKLGVPKAALDMAMRYANWDEDKREGFDVAYQIVRDAIGVPMNLFTYADEQEIINNPAEKPVKEAKVKKTKTSSGENLRTHEEVAAAEQEEGDSFLSSHIN